MSDGFAELWLLARCGGSVQGRRGVYKRHARREALNPAHLLLQRWHLPDENRKEILAALVDAVSRKDIRKFILLHIGRHTHVVRFNHEVEMASPLKVTTLVPRFDNGRYISAEEAIDKSFNEQYVNDQRWGICGGQKHQQVRAKQWLLDTIKSGIKDRFTVVEMPDRSYLVVFDVSGFIKKRIPRRVNWGV